MGIGKFFKALFGGQPPGLTEKAEKKAASQAVKVKKKAAFQVADVSGKPVASRSCVCVITIFSELDQYLTTNLKPVVKAGGFTYDDRPSIDMATESRIVIMDATPDTDAKMHSKYDKIIRMKKALGKTHDVACVIAPRENFKKYPRGTYPKLLYFCVQEDDLNHRDPDLPPEGMDTIVGPRLYNFCDITDVISATIKSFSVAKSIKP